MLLRTKPRKLQTGGSLNLAKNEAPPVDIRWKQFDISGYRQAPLQMPTSLTDSGTSGGLKTAAGGLPSDIAFATNKLEFYRNKLRTGLSGPKGKEYSESVEANDDSNQVTEWAKKISMLKSMEDNYKTTKTQAIKAKDDYAIFGGKALVRDNSNNGAYVIADVRDMLTERIKEGKSMRNRYTPATVGEALSVRFEDPNFSAFNQGTGDVLDNLLSNVVDSESVFKDMDNLFKEAGMINEETSTFVSSKDGSARSLTELVKNLEDASTMAAKNNNVRSNAPTLANAIDLFTKDLTPTQIQTLRNKAMAQFVTNFGNAETTEAQAAEWVNNQVDATIAKRASIYLNFAAKGKAGKASAAKGETDLSKLKVNLNAIDLNRMGVGKKITLEGDYQDADDLTDKFTILANVNANSLPISKAYIAASGPKGENKTLDKNQFIKDLTWDQLPNNLFLLDKDSTPISKLNNGQGLSKTVVNPQGGPMRILQGMPYSIDKDGNYKIEWERVKKVMDWGKKYRELYDTELRRLGKAKTKGARLSEEESIPVIQATEKLLGKLDDDPTIKRGDIAMIPILTVLPPRGYHDTLENVMSNSVSSTEKAELAKGNWDKDIHKTFAFTVLPDGPNAHLPNAYGDAMKIDKEMTVQQILDDYATTQRIEAKGFDVMDILMNSASVSPTVMK
jgi:hypothetical protein